MMKRRIFFTVSEIPFKLKGQQVLRDWLDQVAAQHKAKIASLSYVFVSDEHLLSMNKEFLQHDTYTDIITFPYDDGESDGLVGEIFISIDRVRENAAEFGVVFDQELRRVMAHGLLHLAGFKDKTAKEVKAMRAAEDGALALYGK
jgi:probable rRNA maturation factor